MLHCTIENLFTIIIRFCIIKCVRVLCTFVIVRMYIIYLSYVNVFHFLFTFCKRMFECECLTILSQNWKNFNNIFKFMRTKWILWTGTLGRKKQKENQKINLSTGLLQFHTNSLLKTKNNREKRKKKYIKWKQ